MKVAVVGSRTFHDYNLLKDTLDGLDFKIDLIVSGGAKGADSLAEKYASERGITTKIYYANWNLYGKSAGFRRNYDIVKDSDALVAFWDGESVGTKHSINLAERLEKRVIVKIFENE